MPAVPLTLVEAQEGAPAAGAGAVHPATTLLSLQERAGAVPSAPQLCDPLAAQYVVPCIVPRLKFHGP